MALPLFDLTLPNLDREASVVAEGNVVVSRSSDVDGLLETGLPVRTAPPWVEPPHTDEGTCALVLVANDAQSAIQRADSVRAWAHESVLPLVVVLDDSADVDDPLLWRHALTCAHRGESGRVCRLLGALARLEPGLPHEDDVEEAWDLRQQLREIGRTCGGVGLDAFVTKGMAFIGGSLPAGAPIASVVRCLEVSPRTRLNIDALRVVSPHN